MASVPVDFDLSRSIRKSARDAAVAAAAAAVNGNLSSSPDRAKVATGIAVGTFILRLLTDIVKRKPQLLNPLTWFKRGE